MALFNVIEAKQSDIGRPIYIGQEKETNKSQLDMLIAQIRQLQEEGAHQRIQTKEQELKNEELQLQLQQEIKERRQDIKELTKIKRNRRSDNETDEHLKELIRAEINPLIAGLSSCEVGDKFFSANLGEDI